MNISDELEAIRERVGDYRLNMNASALHAWANWAHHDRRLLLNAVEKVLELLDAQDEEATNNRLSIDQRDPNVDSSTVAMLSGVVIGRMQTSELVRRSIKNAMEDQS